jgi:hypothetical protein
LTDEVIIHGRIERDALLGVYLQHSSRISRTDLARMMRVSATGVAPITFNSVGSNVKAQKAWLELDSQICTGR